MQWRCLQTESPEEHLGPRKRKQEDRDDYITRSFTIHTLHQMFISFLCVGYSIMLTVARPYSVDWKDGSWMIFEKNSEGSGRDVIEVISRNLPGRAEDKHKKLLSGRDSKRISPESYTILLDYHIILLGRLNKGGLNKTCSMHDVSHKSVQNCV
jgi:hypothetical protein